MSLIDMLAQIDYDASLKNLMFDIFFENSGEDSTEFTVHEPENFEQVKQQLCECWRDFCKENRLDENCVTDVIFIGNDPYEEDEDAEDQD